VVLEALVDVTVALEVSSGFAELARVGAGAGEGGGQSGAAREEPRLDGIAVPFHDVVSSGVVVEALPKRVLAAVVHITTCRASGSDGAVLTQLRVGLTQAIDVALLVGVQDVFVDLVVIDALDNVDLNTR
jgi:hypothetical protein